MRLFRVLSLLLLVSICGSAALAQKPPVLVTQPVNNSVRTVLPGNVHPLARPEFDGGEAPPDLPLNRMLLVLKRSDQQEAALRGLIDDQQDKHSATYHQWLTPEEFGARFGPSDSDIAAVTNWLAASGFTVTQVSKGRTIIEFSGTAGLVKQAFGTAIHKYAVNGEEHRANAGNPSIPTALTPVVRGVASLNNFPKQPHHTVVGPFTGNYHGQNAPLPLFTFNFQGTTFFGVGPADFATIYNVQPLWNAGIDGTGQTIAIVGESNINIQDIRNFRSIFGLPAKDPQIILNGPDPGLQFDETEAVLDVSWSGAVAKNATIDFVVSESTETSAGIDLSAIYIVDNNLAPVMSESYGACEAALGNAGNAFYFALWEQAAAQGITVLLSAGDGGSAGCDDFNTASAARFGLAVSGFASTPFNVAVGGTDFDQTPANASTFWNATNNAQTGESAKSYIRETPWNDSCAGVEFGLNGCTQANSNFFDIIAGSGGPSNCALTDSFGNCQAGYAKPAWQTGTGVPNDGLRDTPDVSLFASNGFNGSFYILCEADQLQGLPCSLNPFTFLGVGGTSASAPAFAGIMALVNQKTGARQGNANFVLYKLAAPAGNSCNSSTVALTGNSCVFYDTTKGNNSVPCVAGSPNCGAAPSGGLGVLVDSHGTPAWTTTPGYDMATGLGTVNAANLVNKWNTATFSASTTTLTNLSPVTIAHGQTVNVSVTVAPKAGTGTPTGDVALMGGPNGKSLGIDAFTLAGGVATGTTHVLPGGTYSVTAHYEGDGTFGASDSSPAVSVTVSAENSSVFMPGLVIGANASGSPVYSTSVAYGSPYLLRADVRNSLGQFCNPAPLGEIACPTGNVSFTDNDNPLDAGTYKLNSLGYTEDQAIQLTGGSHNLVANYVPVPGDNSYNASTDTQPVTITKAATSITNVAAPSSAAPGQSFTVTGTVSTQSSGVAPTGTVTFFVNGTPLPGTVQLIPTNGSFVTGASLSASLSTSISTPGSYNITATYSGDGNYANALTSNSAPIIIADFTVPALLGDPAAANPGQSASTTMLISPVGTGTFSSNVTYTCSGLPTGVNNCSFNPTQINAGTGGATTVTITVQTLGPFTGAAAGARPKLRAQKQRLWLPLSLPLASMVLLGLAGRRLPRRYKIVGLCLTLALTGLLLACGGGSSSPPPQISVTVSPTPPVNTLYPSSILPGEPAQTQTFKATVNNSTNQGVNWEVNGVAGGSATFGTIDASGNYTAPAAVPSPATFNVTAVAQADTTKSGNASVTIHTPTPTGTSQITVTVTEGTLTHSTTFNLTVN